ncbi:DNA mismatch repair endonuclease MutL [Candidatus Woesearchaeota archaeon]|nr:DNA mismatch repair endonuclease MutL [Candidatus Woesearchaeota archaeon]
MSKINLLSEDLINKIAAGEVIERPASVIKELVENSLDASATKITVEIEDSGKKLIRITDNGEGMDQEDAEKSLLRHATSKINSDEDLFSIKTLGFRGEALASIAAVSHLTILTKQKDKVEGYKIVAEGGNVIQSTVAGREAGTTIEVNNLFFNTPARKKFLKTDAVELRHSIDIIVQYALLNPQVAFKLIHERHELVNSPAVGNLRDNIASIYGISTAKDLLEVEYNSNNDDTTQSDIQIHGFISKPSDARNDKNQQSIFVNGRWVKNEEISQAAYDAFHSMLFVNKHPIFVLMLEVNPDTIDVNVHPSKTQIKFEQRDEIYYAVFTAVKETLRKNNLIPIVNVEFEEQMRFGTPKSKKDINNKNINKNGEFKPNKYVFEPSAQSILEVKESDASYASDSEDIVPRGNIILDVSDKDSENNEIENDYIPKFPPMKLLGQIHKTFFVAETPEGMFLIDQHAAHERVMYEELMNQFLNQNMATQQLLQGEILNLSASDYVIVQEQEKLLKKLGFKVEPFGNNTFVLKTVPTLLGRIQPLEMFLEVVSKLQEGVNQLEKFQEIIITRMACRAAVMAGDELSIVEMDAILKELAWKNDPYTCPHGRPVMIKTDISELEKKFKRKG